MSVVLPSTWTIRSAASFAELASLEGITRVVFGAGDRSSGWFERKLVREVIDPALTQIAFDADGAALGYALVGAPASLGAARTAGLGVHPEVRQRGLGRALLDRACASAREAGYDRLLTVAEPDRVDFYSRVDFTITASMKTLLAGRVAAAPTRAPAVRPGPPASWSRPRTIAVCGWLEEAWGLTPDGLRETWTITDAGAPIAWAHVSREGSASLVHRLLVAEARRGDALVATVVAAAAALRAALTPRGPLLLYGLPSVSPITEALIAARWAVAQVGHLMTRPVSRAR
ncbi:MAG: GNAT family N-acetyltransferase [Nannocystaceae bacterium]